MLKHTYFWITFSKIQTLQQLFKNKWCAKAHPTAHPAKLGLCSYSLTYELQVVMAVYVHNDYGYKKTGH